MAVVLHLSLSADLSANLSVSSTQIKLQVRSVPVCQSLEPKLVKCDRALNNDTVTYPEHNL